MRVVSPSSLVIAYALGVLLTFVVVALSAWRVSVLNIVAAVRGMPEPIATGGRRRVGLGVTGLALGVALGWSGWHAAQATPFALGISLAVISLVPLTRAAGVPERIAFTGAGLALLTWWLLPFDAMSAIAGRDLSMDFSAWVVSGSDARGRLDLAHRLQRRPAARRHDARHRPDRSLAPVLKMAMAYPLRVRFRTGVTLAMFTLVVFTIVVGATTWVRSFARSTTSRPSAAGTTSTPRSRPRHPSGTPTPRCAGKCPTRSRLSQARA